MEGTIIEFLTASGLRNLFVGFVVVLVLVSILPLMS